MVLAKVALPIQGDFVFTEGKTEVQRPLKTSAVIQLECGRAADPCFPAF